LTGGKVISYLTPSRIRLRPTNAHRRPTVSPQRTVPRKSPVVRRVAGRRHKKGRTAVAARPCTFLYQIVGRLADPSPLHQIDDGEENDGTKNGDHESAKIKCLN